MTTESDKVPWNLSVNQKIKRLMQIHCAETGREISTLTETLWVNFLQQEKGAKKWQNTNIGGRR